MPCAERTRHAALPGHAGVRIMDGPERARRSYARGAGPVIEKKERPMLRFLTSGESHGPGLTAIIEGLPAGLPLSAEEINVHLARRQGGYGRGGRMKIEKDQAIVRSGIRHGLTLGSPVTLAINNRDCEY